MYPTAPLFPGITAGVIVFILILFFAWYITCWVCSGLMAARLGRNVAGWVLLGILISPLLVMLCLWALDETPEKRRERIMEEEEWRIKVRNDKGIN